MKNLTDKEAYNENMALDGSLWKMSSYIMTVKENMDLLWNCKGCNFRIELLCCNKSS